MQVFGILAREFDHIEWDSRPDGVIAAGIRAERPMWVRVANFFERNLSLLRLLPPGQLVLWKLEHWGSDTTFDRVPSSPGTCTESYTNDLLAMGHHVVPYTFTARNRELLASDIPTLGKVDMAVLPVAQKSAASGADGVLRSALGVRNGDVLMGAGGLLHPAKGIDEIAQWFISSCDDPRLHLVCRVIPDDESTTSGVIRRRWEESAGASSSRFHVHVGEYGQWEQMCSFYSGIDAMLVNSVSDSWGRMVSEAIGFGVPTIVRRADCATNHIAPDVVLVDNFADLTLADVERLLGLARDRAPTLADYVDRNYQIPVVRDRALTLMRISTPPEWWGRFDELAHQDESTRILDEMIDH